MELLIKPSAARENDAPRLTAAIASAPNGSVVTLAPGEYYLTEPVIVENKEDLTITGEGARILTYYDRSNGGGVHTKSTDGFRFTNCRHLTLRRLTLRSALPTNYNGVVAAISGDTVDLQFHPDVPLNGSEIFTCGQTYDPTGRPKDPFVRLAHTDPVYEEHKDDRIVIAGQVVTTNTPAQGMKSEVIGENLWRFYHVAGAGSLKVGDEVCMAFSYYGCTAFIFAMCEDVLLDEVYIPNYGGMGVVVLPRSKDFTFRRVYMDNPDKSEHRESLQSDGLHIVGLTGKLIISGCVFDALSDDPLNIHTQILTVEDASTEKLTVKYNKVKGIVYDNWARHGDTVKVYDAQDFRFKGVLIVDSFEGHTVVPYSHSLDVKPGDLLINDAYFCDVEITDSIIRHSRGSFKLRSVRSAVLKNNIISDGGNGVNVSVSFVTTLEGGPAENVLIEDNLFTRCSHIRPVNIGTYPANDGVSRHLHKNVTVRHNRFVDNESEFQVTMFGTDIARIEDNVFVNCTNPYVDVSNCDDVTVRNNRIE